MKSLSFVLVVAFAVFPSAPFAQENTGAAGDLPSDLTADQRTRLEACKDRLTREQLVEFLFLAPIYRQGWLAEHCEPSPGPATPGAQDAPPAATAPAEPEPPLPGDLDQAKRYRFEACRGDLLLEEKEEFARLDPPSRSRWLDVFCDQRSPYLKCRKRLTAEQRRQYLSEPLGRRVPWLRAHCHEAPPDPLFERELPAEEHAALVGSNQRVYRMCSDTLTIDQRTYYLEAPVLEQQHVLTDWCGVAPTALATAPVNFDFRPAPGPRFVEKSMERHGWPASRIAAHALFWPGIVFLVGGLIAGGIVDFDFPAIWAPPLALGAGLTLGGIISGLKYLSWKEERK